MAKDPCSAIVRVWKNAKGEITKMRLVCPHNDCPDSPDKCAKKREESNTGDVREWCGCKPKEDPTVCHIVIKTIGKGDAKEKAGEQEILCAGNCDDDPEAVCTPVILREVRLWPSGTITEVGCECF
jgi:hypothetical protein